MFSIYKEVFYGTVTSISTVKIDLVKRLLVPVLLLSAIDTATLLFLFGVVVYLLLIVKLYLYTVIAVTTHRLVLLGSKSVTQWGIFRWGKRELRFALYVILLGIILIPASFVTNFSGTAGVLASVVFLWIVGRFALTFPGIALDEKTTFDQSWRWTSNHNILMLIVAGFFPSVFFFASLLLARQLPHFLYFWSLFSSIFLVIEIALVSNAYKTISNDGTE